MNIRRRFFTAALAVFVVGGIAVPSSHAQVRVIQSPMVMSSGGAYLGINMTDVTSENMSKYKLGSERGVIVSSVVKGSPAEAATIKEDDVILEFSGSQVWSMMQFRRLVEETPPGRKVELGISRDGKRITLTAQLENRKDPQANNRYRELPDLYSGQMERDFSSRIPDFLEQNPGRAGQRGPMLGIALQELPEQLADYLGVPGKKGVLVSSITEGSPSDGKLRSGDVIIRAKGKEVEGPEDLIALVRRESGDSIAFDVIRDKKEIKVVIILPSEGGKGFKL
jgi:serine protease Do